MGIKNPQVVLNVQSAGRSISEIAQAEEGHVCYLDAEL